MNDVSQPSSLVRAVSSRDVVGRRVGLDPAQLAEVVDGVRGMAGAAADADDEQAPAALAQRRQAARHLVDLFAVDRAGEVGDRVEVAAAVLGRRHRGEA